MLDQAIRFGTILLQPEFEQGGSILEVGSGSEGISAFSDDPILGIDLRFDETSERNLKAIRASATALPLRDDSFARVICSDMLEHLSQADRSAAIEELVRVTRGTLFLACPCGANARKVDGWLLRLYEIFSVKPPDWLVEHLANGIPDPASIRAVLENCGTSYREITGESTMAHFIASLLISFRALNDLWRSVFQRRQERAKLVARLATFPGISAYRRMWVVKVT